ncbi:MAG: hypothetical protein HYY45_01010 [Deltaproteobacteria bacterium]|nr:hypothetical protein [Deltaproteobacteria bacterium]
MSNAYVAGASYGWRARIGMLVPSLPFDTNVHEFYLMAPEGVSLIITWLGVGGMAQERYDRAIANIAEPLRMVTQRKADVILQAGVPPLVTRGPGFEAELLARVAQLTSVPFITDVGASGRAMKALGLAKVVMLSSTFDDEMARHISVYLERAGIGLVGAAQAHIPREVVGTVALEVVYRAARKLFESHRGNANGIWITQASMPSVAVIEDLERSLDVPVVTSAQALMWAGLRTVGVREAIAGFGKLFAIEKLPQ